MSLTRNYPLSDLCLANLNLTINNKRRVKINIVMFEKYFIILIRASDSHALTISNLTIYKPDAADSTK